MSKSLRPRSSDSLWPPGERDRDIDRHFTMFYCFPEPFSPPSMRPCGASTLRMLQARDSEILSNSNNNHFTIVGNVQVLALPSYRVNFYGVHHQLAELTSTYLHFIADINDDRTRFTIIPAVCRDWGSHDCRDITSPRCQNWFLLIRLDFQDSAFI